MPMDYKDFFPDCAGCETNVFVSRKGILGTFKCEYCGCQWDDEEYETLLDEFEHRDVRLYVLRSAGGYSFFDIARGTNWSEDDARRRYNTVRAELKEMVRCTIGPENIDNPYTADAEASDV